MTEAEQAGFENGFVGYTSEGHFVHWCKCGAFAGNGHGVSLRNGKLGIWFCKECNIGDGNAGEKSRTTGSAAASDAGSQGSEEAQQQVGQVAERQESGQARQIIQPTDAELIAVAQQRYKRDSLTHPDHRPYVQDGQEPWSHWFVGLACEREFATLFNTRMNMALLPHGDGHIDFEEPFRGLDGVVRKMAVDVKGSSRSGAHLLVEVRAARRNTIYVQVDYYAFSNKAVIRGWMIGAEVMKYPQDYLPGKNIFNYMVPIGELKPIAELLARHAPEEKL